MADITIRFRRDAKTGKREIVVHLESEPDATPHEHERDHRKLVESLLGMPLTEDMGEIVVERVQKEGSKIGTVAAEPGQREREAQKSKG